MELAERLEALRSRNEEPLPDNTPSYTDEEAKEVFLSALEEGMTIPEAAKLTGRTATWFRRRRQPSSRNWDAEFSNLYDEIMEVGGPNRENLSLRIFTALVKAAEEGNVRAQEKILATYSSEFQWMRSVQAQGPVTVESLQVFFGQQPLEALLQLKEARDQTRRELPPVIDQ